MQNQIMEQIEQPDYDKILEKQDFFPKIFLMPSEIKLHKDQGLKVIKRSPNHPDKFQEEKVLPISIDQDEIKSFRKNQNTDKKRHPAGHGLLSLFKKTPTRRIKLAICICVYSEPKHMLKSTIKGIQNSYKHFLQKAGILPHEIILTVIFDGIQKLNASKDQTENMISFFNEIDIKNGFVHKPYGKSLDEYLKELEEKNFHLSRLDGEKVQDISLFTEDQLKELKVKLFESQYNEYMRIKALLRELENIKQEIKVSKNIRVESLPHDVNKKYEELCLNFCIENNMYYETQEEIQEYLSTKRNIRIKLIYEALHDTEELCKRYIQSRQDKAILYPVRFEADDLRSPQNKDQDEQMKLNDPKSQMDAKEKQYNYMFFVVKHKNQGKLSSHMLFFEGFCKLFDPEYCILTDVGIKPHQDAIYRMWQHMEKKPKCGGVCGYMGLQLENPSDDLGYRQDGYDPSEHNCLTRCAQHFVTVQRAQQFEYHFAHMLDKPFQAAFGYIHVLPGAFSGYRWKALKSVQYQGTEYPNYQDDELMETERDLSWASDDSDEQQETLMRRYLKTATTDQSEISLEDSNMYLAQDRIMCLGIHSLGYDLDYLPDAGSTVDPVTSLTRLLGQRRRWINGSWFAFNYVRSHSYQRTTFKFLIQLLYYSFVQKMTWISPAIFYIAMNLTLVSAVREYIVPIFQNFFNVENDYQLYDYTVSLFNVKNVVESIPDIINFVYIMIIFALVLHSLLVNHNTPKFKKVYYMASTLLGFYGMAVLILLIYNSYEIVLDMASGRGKEDFIIPLIYLRSMIIFILVGHALPILWTFNPKKWVETVTSLFSYLFYTPTYINILMIFAFCRIDDLSWGTKGLDADGADGANSVAREWQRRKYIFVLQFISTNVIISFICVKASDMDITRNALILVTTVLVVFMLLFRLIPAMIYLIKYYCVKWFGAKFSPQFRRHNMSNGERILKALRVIELKIKEIQKAEVKKKKEAEYQKVVGATSQLLSKSLSNFGNKLRNKVAQHMLNNNVIPKKELVDKNKAKMKKKINLRKKLKTVQEASNEESEDSRNLNLKGTTATTLQSGETLSSPNRRFKNRLQQKEKQKMKDRESSKNKEQQEKSAKENDLSKSNMGDSISRDNSNYDLAIPNAKRQDIKSRIEAMKNRRNKTKLKTQENQ